MRRLWLIVVVAAAVAVGAPVADAAAPRILIVSGKPLPHQVVVSDWAEILRGVTEPLAGALAIQRAQLAARPRLNLSLFWGPRWNDYLAVGHRADRLRPADADQHGWFYPSWHGRPAAIDLPGAGSWPRRAPAKTLAMLVRYGIPVATG